MRRRTTNIIRGLAALVLLVGLLVGVPWALATQVGWPLPTAVPTWEQFSRALTRGDLDDWSIIKALAVLVWLAWAQVAANVMAEAVAVARRRPTRPVPAVGPLRSLATNLVAAVAVLVSTLGRPSVAPDEGVPALQVALASATIDDASTADSPPREGWSPDAHHASDDETDGEAELGTGPRWTVQHRDTLWDIAESTLGDGLRWREIHHLNAGRIQPDGGTLGEDGLIRKGWVLVLPEDASVDGEADAAGQSDDAVPDDHDQPIVIGQGDTLWDLSGDHLGDPLRWPELYEENRGQPQPDGRQLHDPDLIQPGWALDLPLEEESPEVGDRDAPGTDAADASANGPSATPRPPRPSIPALSGRPPTEPPLSNESASSPRWSATARHLRSRLRRTRWRII